jgi:hypothetical protein
MGIMQYAKISKYEGIFHDGAIWEIKQNESLLQLCMESAQMLPEWNEDNIILSKRETVTGKLVLEGIKNIKENDSSSLEEFRVKESYERAEVFRLRIKSNSVLLLLLWIKYFPEYEESALFKYEIEAEKIYWENIPTLFDDYWDSL